MAHALGYVDVVSFDAVRRTCHHMWQLSRDPQVSPWSIVIDHTRMLRKRSVVHHQPDTWLRHGHVKTIQLQPTWLFMSPRSLTITGLREAVGPDWLSAIGASAPLCASLRHLSLAIHIEQDLNYHDNDNRVTTLKPLHTLTKLESLMMIGKVAITRMMYIGLSCALSHLRRIQILHICDEAGDLNNELPNLSTTDYGGQGVLIHDVALLPASVVELCGLSLWNHVKDKHAWK